MHIKQKKNTLTNLEQNKLGTWRNTISIQLNFKLKNNCGLRN